MRVIITARQSLTPVYQAVLARLVRILEVVSRNPSNPNFDQYLFESISALIRCVAPKLAFATCSGHSLMDAFVVVSCRRQVRGRG
jgi:CAS/CSE protein, C-terminus